MEMLVWLLLVGLLVLLMMLVALWARLGELDHRLKALEQGRSVAAVPPQPVEAQAAVAAPVSQPAPVQPAPPASPISGGVFEGLIGGRLMIWVGGVALVVAAIFLIRYSIEIGLVTPELRMLAAGLFGLALVAGGEWARVSPRMADDLRISQVLVGAGLATLYATIYGSYWLYGFFGATMASVLMLALTVAALGLSMRHGPPTAVMGLIGGFLTPLLVGDPGAGAEPLIFYLVLLDAAVFVIAIRRGWEWLGGLAVLFSLGWVAVLITDSPFDALAGGWFALVLAILVGAAGRKDGHIGSGWPMAVAAVLISALVCRTDVGLVGVLQFGLAAAASLVLARLRPASRWVPLVAALAGLLVIPAKVLAQDQAMLPAIAGLMTLIYGGGALLLALERRRFALIAAACVGLAGPVLFMRVLDPDQLVPTGWGMLIALLGLAPLALVRRDGSLPESLLAATTATGLLTIALVDLIVWDYLSIGWLVLAIALVFAGVQLAMQALRITGLALLTLTVLKVFLIDAAALEGLLRILSFVGLGAALIVIGRYFGRLVRSGAPVEAPIEPGSS